MDWGLITHSAWRKSQLNHWTQHMQITDCVGYTEVQNLVPTLKKQTAQPECDCNIERRMRQLSITRCRGRRLSSQSGMLFRPCGDSVGDWKEWLHSNWQWKDKRYSQREQHRTKRWDKQGQILISLAYLDTFGWKCWGQLGKGFEWYVRETRTYPVGKRGQVTFYNSNQKNFRLQQEPALAKFLFSHPNASHVLFHLVHIPYLWYMKLFWPFLQMVI